MPHAAWRARDSKSVDHRPVHNYIRQVSLRPNSLSICRKYIIDFAWITHSISSVARPPAIAGLLENECLIVSNYCVQRLAVLLGDAIEEIEAGAWETGPWAVSPE